MNFVEFLFLILLLIVCFFNLICRVHCLLDLLFSLSELIYYFIAFNMDCFFWFSWLFVMGFICFVCLLMAFIILFELTHYFNEDILSWRWIILINHLFIFHSILFEYFMKIRARCQCSKTDSCSFCQFTPLSDQLIIVLLQLFELTFHSFHSNYTLRE